MFNIGDIVCCPNTYEAYLEILATPAETSYQYICARPNYKGVAATSISGLNRMLLWINSPTSQEKVKELWAQWEKRNLYVSFYQENNLALITSGEELTYNKLSINRSEEDNGGLNYL
jgi:hypothetical protein